MQWQMKVNSNIYLYLGWKDEARQKAFETVFFVFEGDLHFLCLVFDSSVPRVKNLTQKVEIPWENKNNSLNYLLSHTSSFQSRYRQFSILGLNTQTWIWLNSTISQKKNNFSNFYLRLWSPNMLVVFFHKCVNTLARIWMP